MKFNRNIKRLLICGASLIAILGFSGSTSSSIITHARTVDGVKVNGPLTNKSTFHETKSQIKEDNVGNHKVVNPTYSGNKSKHHHVVNLTHHHKNRIRKHYNHRHYKHHKVSKARRHKINKDKKSIKRLHKRLTHARHVRKHAKRKVRKSRLNHLINHLKHEIKRIKRQLHKLSRR